MSTLQNIKDRCYVDDISGCWLWRGGLSDDKHPRIYAPNLSKGGAMDVQTGARAVWQAHTGKPIPKGHRVYHKGCADHGCVNWEHLACGPTADWGRELTRKGCWKNQPKRMAANQAISRARSTVTTDQAAQVLRSNATGRVLSQETGLSVSLISRIRRGEHSSVRTKNPFLGLMK